MSNVNAKAWFKSWTIRFNALMGILALLPALIAGQPDPAPAAAPLGLLDAGVVVDQVQGVLPQLEQALPVLQGILPAEYYFWVSLVVIVGNALLRARTNVGIGLQDGKPWP